MPEKGIDWTFYRENIEGAYIWGSKGIQVDENLAVDFVVETAIGSERIARAAFEFAKNNGKTNVTVVTKANIVKLTDGNLIKACKKVAEEYPEITLEERFVDVTAAKLSDMEFSKDLQVFVLPNLYGDIITDIAAELQGGLGTAGAANIGAKYAVFEAIHGSAPFLMNNNRGEYADPSSVLRGTAMLLSHIGYQAQSDKLTRALDICGTQERKIVITSFREDASTAEYGDYVIETIKKL
jgi:isocitrate dehydrogenase (NAD+)